MRKQKQTSSKLSKKETKKESEIKPDDKRRAAQHFREVTQPKFRDLLDATTKESV